MIMLSINIITMKDKAERAVIDTLVSQSGEQCREINVSLPIDTLA
jgi:hypothetical protein